MSSHELNEKTALLLMLLAAILFGIMGVFTRVLEDIGFNAMQITFYRLLITALCLLLIIILIDRSAFRIKREDLWIFIVLGVSKAAMDLMFIYSQMYIPLSLASALQMTSPAFVILITWLFFKVKVTKRKWASVAVCLIGALLMARAVPSDTAQTSIGITMGLLGAVSLAIYLLMAKKLTDKGYSVMTVLFYAFVIGLICVAPFTNVVDSVEMISSNMHIIGHLLGLGIICTLIPYYLDLIGVKHLNTITASVIQTTEIISSAVVGALLFGEKVGMADIIGIALIFMSVLLIATEGKDPSKEASPS